MGLVTGWFAERLGAAGHLRLFLATGILGGFTTFSAFSLDAVLLWERHEYLMAALYVGGSVAGAIAGLAVGALDHGQGTGVSRARRFDVVVARRRRRRPDVRDARRPARPHACCCSIMPRRSARRS